MRPAVYPLNLTTNQDNTMSRLAVLTAATSWQSSIPAADITVEKALADAGLNYSVRKVPNQYELDGVVYDGKGFQVVRSDNNESVSCVGGKFRPIQNEEMFADIHRVAAANGAFLEGAGEISGGEYTFVQYKLPQQITVEGRAGDISELYLLAFNSFSGTKHSFLTVFSHRLFCLNQYKAIAYNNKQLDTTGFFHKIGHNAQAPTRLKIANETFSKAVAGAVAVAEFNSLLNSKPMDNSEMRAFVAELLPAAKEGEEPSTQVINRREGVFALFKRGEGNLGRSRLDAFNAVTEYFNHEITNKETSGRSRNENRLISLLPGGNHDKIITRAAELLAA